MILDPLFNGMVETVDGKLSDGEGLIRPRKGKKDPEMGPDVIMVMIPSDLKYLVRISKAKKIPLSNLELYRVYQVKDGTNAPPTLLGPFLGAPQAVMGMEKAIALGGQRIWVLGWCGSLQPELRIGDLVLPSTAISEEGTSQHYPVGERTPKSDEHLSQMLEASLKKEGQSVFKGAVWTTDAPYRETPRKIKAYQKRGVLAVEMEMSALMTLAHYRKVKLAGLLVVSDELFNLKWHSGFSNPKLKKSCRLAGEILLDLVESMTSQIVK